MNITEIDIPGYERVVHGVEPESGLNAYISVHSTRLGPSLGGIRMLPYTSEAEALDDVNRLARGMTYKAAVARTGQGGGKAAMIGDPAKKTPEMFRAMGRLIEYLGGAYLAAEDMNMTVADLEIVRTETAHVTGLAIEDGFSGNPSPLTARGCFAAIGACLEERFGDDSFEGRRIAIHGPGAVGSILAILCRDAGAEVVVADLDESKARNFAREQGIESMADPDALLLTECDVLSPCARGAILNEETIPKLQCAIVAGAANNQLRDDADAERIDAAGILYAPDYVANAGGIINIACEFEPGGYRLDTAQHRTDEIAESIRQVFRIAAEENIPTAVAADHLAEQIIAAGPDAL